MITMAMTKIRHHESISIWRFLYMGCFLKVRTDGHVWILSLSGRSLRADKWIKGKFFVPCVLPNFIIYFISNCIITAVESILQVYKDIVVLGLEGSADGQRWKEVGAWFMHRYRDRRLFAVKLGNWKVVKKFEVSYTEISLNIQSKSKFFVA